MERIAFEIGGYRREYLFIAPGHKRRPVSARVPLILFLHGTGGTAAWADAETGWSHVAKREGFALALPEALRPDLNSPPKFQTNPQRWNDGSRSMAEFATDNSELNPAADNNSSSRAGIRLSIGDDVAFLSAVIDDAAKRAAIDPQRVFVSGFSNGAAIAFRIAAELADRIAAVAPVAGYCGLPHPKPARPVPTLYMVGSADPLVPLRGGDVRSPWRNRYVRRPPVSESLEKWAEAMGCETIPRTEANSRGIRQDLYPGPVVFMAITIDGLGHHWPGGAGQFNHQIAGPPSDAINATERVWEFFKSV